MHENQNSYFRVIELWIILFFKMFCHVILFSFNTNAVCMKRTIMNEAIGDCLKIRQ